MAMVTVPSRVQVRAKGYGGPVNPYHPSLRGIGLGQCIDPSSGEGVDCSSPGAMETGTFGGSDPISTLPVISPNPLLTNTTISTPSGNYQLNNGTLVDPNGNVVASGIQLPATQAAGMTPAQIAASLAALTNSAINAYRATIAPSVVPGSSLVYNPATGQFLPASGAGQLTPAQLLAAQGTAVGISSTTLMMLGIAGIVLLIVMQGKR